MTSLDPARWLDRFFDAYHRHRPVNATFIGRHEHDARLPDPSAGGLEASLADTEALLAEAPPAPGASAPPGAADDGPGPTARAAATSPPAGGSTEAPREPWPGESPGALRGPSPGLAEALDVRMARGFLEVERWERRSRHFERGNPSWATGDAVFGAMSLFLNHGGALPWRVEAATARCHGIPGFLAASRSVLDGAPRPWTERALRECRGADAFFGRGIDLLVAELPTEGSAGPLPPGSVDGLRSAAAAARHAFAEHEAWLRALPVRPDSEVSAGEEALDLYLRHAHFIQDPADEIARRARAVIAETRAWLEAHASDHGASSPEGALAALREIHPSPGGYLARYRELWEEMGALAERERLVTWPDFPIRYVPRPPWSREAAPHLYFLFYRSPAARRRPPVHDYLVAPLDPAATEDEARAFLRAHHDSVIKLNHVVHHGGLGHHVQNWSAFHGRSRVGRIAAVDCAARIAMPCGGTMAEGWACYATDLVREHGGLTPLEAYAERHARVRMAARAVVDVELHRGRMSLDEAAAFYVDAAGMTGTAARAEAVKNSMFPGMALMYLEGTDRIHDLRRRLSARLGPAFDLRGFHDSFLAHGSTPVALVAEAMLADGGAGR